MMSTFPLFRRVALCSRRALAIPPVRVNGEGGPTVSVAELAIEFSVAVIVVTPTAQVLARPVPPTVATVAGDDVHVTEPVKSCVLPFV